MSAPRLTFLYPFLFSSTAAASGRGARRAAAAATAAVAPSTVRGAARRAFGVEAAGGRRGPSTIHQRYGTANEPLPHLGAGAAGGKKEKEVGGGKEVKEERGVKEERTLKEQKDINTTEQDMTEAATTAHALAEAEDDPTKPNRKTNKRTKQPSIAPTHQLPQDETIIEALPPTGKLPSSNVTNASPPVEGPSPSPPVYANPLETVLNMPPPDPSNPGATALYANPETPSSQTQTGDRSPAGIPQIRDQPIDHQRPPHISTPPYVHHFDTYSLVRRLEEGGWTEDQSVTLMKAVRTVLAGNMELARAGLVSKSNVENESYLFSAACSELKTEIQTKRRTEGERSRTDRTQLQHEVDILSQRMTQETLTMKDELKGMFDDRKMFVRNDQRDMERKIQELNYRITVGLNSDSRSDVEGVRWIITKRAISALAICVAMILGSLKFASSVAQWEEEEKRALAAARGQQQENSPKAGRGGGHGGGHGGGGNNGGGNGGGNGMLGTDAELRDILVRQGDNPSFVSLG